MTTWLDVLAKSVVVISAMLYIVGRKYAESYYATIGLPSNNLPLSVQEYLFMSTRSLSFLNKTLFTLLISILPAILPYLAGFVKEFVKDLFRKLLGLEPNQQESNSNPSQSDKTNPTPLAGLVKEFVKDLFRKLLGLEPNQQESNSNPSQSDKTNPTPSELLARIWHIIKTNLLYIIPVFLVLSFFILLPGASESGRIDAIDDMQSAPFSEVVLSQPSIPELTPSSFPGQPSLTVYRYSGVQTMGNLGDQWLFLISDSSGNSSVISIPDSQIISVRYMGTTAPIATGSTLTPVVTPTSAVLPTGTP